MWNTQIVQIYLDFRAILLAKNDILVLLMFPTRYNLATALILKPFFQVHINPSPPRALHLSCSLFSNYPFTPSSTA